MLNIVLSGLTCEAFNFPRRVIEGVTALKGRHVNSYKVSNIHGTFLRPTGTNKRTLSSRLETSFRL